MEETRKLQPDSKAIICPAKGKAKEALLGEKKPELRPVRGSALRQILVAFVANIGTINTGMVFGFSAVAIPQMEMPNSTLPINEEQASWVASLSSISTPIGCLLSGWLMDALGRRAALIMVEVPLLVGWILIAMANNLPLLYAGRLVVGFGSGLVGAPARVYTAEATQPHLRGMLSALASLGVSFGVLFMYALGACLPNWRHCAGVSAAVPLVALVLAAVAAPETPSWLIAHGRTKEARCSLARLRGDVCDLDGELDQLARGSSISAGVGKGRSQMGPLNGQNAEPEPIMTALFKKSSLWPLGILVAYFVIYQWSGVNAVTFYAVEVVRMAGIGGGDNDYLTAVGMGAVRLVATAAACVLMRRIGRRPLTLVSSIGCGVTMLGLAGSLAFLPPGGSFSAASWIPVICLFGFSITSTMGYLVVPWVMIGEVFPTRVRGILGGVTTCAAHLSVFTVVKTFPLLQHLLSRPGAFCFYGCVSLLGSIFFATLLPETKGCTLQEIEDYFSGLTPTLKPAAKEVPKNVKGPGLA
ncbi:facilitated trehalose transporter Tret1-2 homolog isoform X2 [Ischnura elegans]|uniref:facilitated trehalose transporter Tret1-2 homolog isoform X2 n=1 Tax=Ischnura elegans TaxID=197161 RepID=UPI001ED896B8|nr:facilitated trehalose transporter Tret1-2 homolog isoform X2 [Ischnura elegans]